MILVSGNTARIKWKYGLVEELIRRKERKIRGASVLIKNKESQGIIQRPINKLYKLETSGSTATFQLKFIDENEIKNVTSAKSPLFRECKIKLERHNYSYDYCIFIRIIMTSFVLSELVNKTLEDRLDFDTLLIRHEIIILYTPFSNILGI